MQTPSQCKYLESIHKTNTPFLLLLTRPFYYMRYYVQSESRLWVDSVLECVGEQRGKRQGFHKATCQGWTLDLLLKNCEISEIQGYKLTAEGFLLDWGNLRDCLQGVTWCCWFPVMTCRMKINSKQHIWTDYLLSGIQYSFALYYFVSFCLC